MRARFYWRSVWPPVLAVVLCLSAAGCGSSASKGTVQVLYAASLVNLMEHTLGPDFTKSTGYGYAGEGKGSTALANEIKGHLREPDIFISADPAVNQTLMGTANGNFVSWYLSFLGTQMVIGFNPNSRFAADLTAARNGQKNWYDVLREPGFRLGRTDPALDPKGYRTILLFQLAERYYQVPGLAQQILGAGNNPAQIFPEEDLIARLGAGQLDAGVFYLNEVKDQRLPYIALPAAINLGDPSQAAAYAAASYTTAQGQVIHGAPIEYSITIPSTSKNQAGAVAFVKYLLSPAGQAILRADGLLPIPLILGGDRASVPAGLQSLLPPSS